PVSAYQPSHLFSLAGNYSVMATVTSREGCSTSTRKSNYITVHPIPAARFKYSPEIVDIIDPVVSFENYSSGAVLYAWDLGDGFNSSNFNVTHQYQDTGS